MASQKLVLLAQDDKTVSLAVIPAPTSEAAATFRLVVEQRYCCGGEGADDDEVATTMEDVACRVPVGELCAATVDRAFQDLVSRLDHPTLIPEVAPAAREAAARVRARYAEEGAQAQPGGIEFRLCVEFVDSFETDSEETGSDLELDDESWERGRCSNDGGGYRHDQGPGAFISDDEDEDEDGAQFSARPYGGALTPDGGPSDGTLLLSGFEARADGPELADQHELTSRDFQRLVRLALHGGDTEGDAAYQRALDGGAPVSRVTRAVLLDQGLRSATARQQQQQQQATSSRGMPARMRTGW